MVALSVLLLLLSPFVAGLWKAGLALFNAFVAGRRLRENRQDLLTQSIIAFAAAAAAFPHYFLFRPDMAHVANFMPGYVVLAAAFICSGNKTSARNFRGCLPVKLSHQLFIVQHAGQTVAAED